MRARRFEEIADALFIGAAFEVVVMSTVECDAIQKLMSPFIDFMVSAGEAERVETHVRRCEPCHRQLQSYISMRSLVARIEVPAPPEDMILETRVALSQARNKNFLHR